ncbi:MAG: class III poly(R)-hydroxyalkanoic acid synthase subunit PhaE [Anaerolineae bacterium]
MGVFSEEKPNMDWQKQAETMMSTWAEAQKKMWESWTELAQPNGAPNQFYPNMMEQWRWLAEQSMQAWAANSGPTIKGVAEQMAASQASMMRFLELSSKAWQVMAPKVEAGEDWQSVLREYSEQWFQQLVGGPTGFVSASKDINQLWRFYIEEWQKLSQPWFQSWGQTPWQFSQGLTGAGSQLAELSRLHWDAYERSFGRMTETPRLGFNRELMDKLINSFDTWVQFRKTSADYHILLARTSAQAFERVMQELVALSEKGEKIDSIRQLMNLWMDTIDQTFSKLYKTEEYLNVQRELSAAVMTYRLKEQEIVEVMLKMLNLPTRSELDDAYRSLYELRKEVKQLKKALKERNGTTPVEVKAEVKKPKAPAKQKPVLAADEPVLEAAGNEG